MTLLRPAYETTLCHGDHAVTLRASLRAAITISNLDGGIPAVLDHLGQGRLSTIRAIILASATDRQQAARLLSSLDGHPLRPFIDKAASACLELVAAILPTPDQAQDTTTSTTRSEAKGKPWADHFADLYGYATGWLGWPPEAAWNASADEITTAFTAHVERLVAVNGGKTDDEPASGSTAYTPERLAEIEELGQDPAFDRMGLQALKARTS